MTGADALAASGAVRELIEALVVGAREREGANLAIQAMPNPSMFAAAKQAAAGTLARLQAAMSAVGAIEVDEPLAAVLDAALALAEPVEELWGEETIVLDGLAGGDRQAAIAAQQRSERLFQPTEDGMAALVATVHRLADDEPEAFAALALSRPAVLGLAFPDPGDPDDRQEEPLDVEAWLAGLRAALPAGDATDRIAAMWAEAERWQVRVGDLRLIRWDLPEGMSAARWNRELDEAQARVTAVLGWLKDEEGFDPLHADHPALPGTGQTFTLAADGSGDFTGLEEAIRAVPSGATLRVRPGRYEPGFLIAKSVDIVGDGPVEEIVIASGFHSVVPVEALGGSLRGVTLRNEGGEDRYALWFTDGWFTVCDCVLECEGEAVVHVTGPRAAARILDTVIRGAQIGVLVRLGGAVVGGCTVDGAQDYGIRVEADGWAIVVRSEISGNGASGIDLASGGEALVRSCRIEGNGGPGIRVAGGASVRIQTSRIAGNGGPDVLDLPGSSVVNDGEPLPEETPPFGVLLSAILISEERVAGLPAQMTEALAAGPHAAVFAHARDVHVAHADWAKGTAVALEQWGPGTAPLHLYRECGQLLEDSERFSRELADAFGKIADGNADEGLAALAATGFWRRRYQRGIDAVAFMIAFIRHRSIGTFEALGLADEAKTVRWLDGWSEALPPGGGEGDDETKRAMACGISVIPIPKALMERRGGDLEPVLAGPAGDAERLWWRLAGIGKDERARTLRDEFSAILAWSLRRLVERGDDGPPSPLEHAAMAVALRPLDLTATSAETVTCSGGHCYPGLGVDLGELDSDNQWYLLTQPEARLVGLVVQAAMGFEHLHASASWSGVAHAGYLPTMWKQRGAADGDEALLFLPDPEDVVFAEVRQRIARIAAERDGRLAEWSVRAEAFLAALPAV